MDCHCIAHTQVPHSSRLFLDFLYDFERVKQFYSYNPFTQQSFTDAAQATRIAPHARRQLVEVLREQNQRIAASAQTLTNLDRLAGDDCVAVVTGQQTGLFTGPALTLYKAITAIKIAN